MTYYRPLGRVIQDYVDWATSDHPRVGIGYPIMDERTNGGAANGEVILFQARSSVGKTAVACNIVSNLCPRPTIFFSLEMAARYIAMRLAAIHTDTPTANIEWELQQTGTCKALAQLHEDFPDLIIIDEPALTLKQMDAAIEEVEQSIQKKVELIVTDFLELIGSVSLGNDVSKVDMIGRKYKDLCRKHDLVGLLLHQVGRGEGGGGAEPLSMEAGRYGGEVSADYVLAAYRPCLKKGLTQEEYKELRWQLWLQFLKTRGGAEIHPEGLLHMINPYSMKISYPYERTEKLPFYPESEPAMAVIS